MGKTLFLSLGVLIMAASVASCSTNKINDALGAGGKNRPEALATQKAHHGLEKFTNFKPIRDWSFKETLKVAYRFYFSERKDPIPEAPLPTAPLNSDSFKEPVTEGYQVTWLGHSAVLIEIEGLKILTDPMFGDRASPFASMGPQRFQPAPLSLNDMPEIDLVILSHDHYDHLDMGTIKALHGKVKHFVMPLGVGAHLKQWGVPPEKITELDWWQELQVSPKLRVAATPARHFSGRGLFDKNNTLWASFAIIGSRHRLFFSGDTGMHAEFSDIGERYGPFDLAFMENGAYDPMWPEVHMQPEETVKAAQMIKAKRLMPIHWGTFVLAHHPWYEPANRVNEIARRENMPLAQPRLGETFGPHRPWPVAMWWNDPLEKSLVKAYAPVPEGALTR